MKNRPAARLLVLFILLILTSSCSPEERLAVLLERHPSLFKSAPDLRDSVVVLRRDSLVSVLGRTVRIPIRTVYHFQHRERTLVLDNARSRRLLAQANGQIGILGNQLQAMKQENEKLNGLAYPKWYQSIWFYIALLSILLLLVSIGLRFYTFTPLALLR